MSKPMTDERLHALESQAVMGTVKTWCQGALLEACEEIRRLREEINGYRARAERAERELDERKRDAGSYRVI